MAEKASMTEASIDEESPEEGEIQDDSTDEESCETTTSRPSKYYGVVNENYKASASTSVEVRRSARLRKTGGRDPHIDNTVARIGYPECVQDVYKNFNYQPVIDNRNEKENKISRQPRRLHRVSPLPDYAPKALEQRHGSVKMSNRSHSEHRKQRRRASEDKKKSYSKKRKSAAVGKNDDIVVLSDSSDIEVQIQKTKKRLKDENFKIEHLKGPKATSSTVNTVTSLDTLNLNKSSSSLEILEVKSKAPPPVVEITETDPSVNTKISIGVVNTEDKKEEIQLRADALKSVLAVKYLNKKKKDNAPVSKDGEVNSQDGANETSPLTSKVQTSNEPVDMELSLTDDENESSIDNTIACVVQSTDLHQEEVQITSRGNMCQESGEVADQLVIVDEIGCSPKSQGADELVAGLEEEDEQLLRAQLLIAISSKQTPIPVQGIVPEKVKANGSKSTVQISKIPLQVGKQIPQKLKAAAAARPLSTKSNPYRFNKNTKKLIYTTKRMKKLPGKNVKLLLKKYSRPTMPPVPASSNLPDGGDHQKMLKSVPYLDENTTKPVSSPIPPTSGRIVIRLGEDTDTDDEMETAPLAKPEPPKIVPPADDLMKSVDEFLKQVRQNVEQNQKPQLLPSEIEVLADQKAVESAQMEPLESNSDSPLSELVSKCSPKPAVNSKINLEEQTEPAADISEHSVNEDEIPLSSFTAVIKSVNNSPSSPAQGQGKKKSSTPSLNPEKTVKNPKTRITAKKTPLLPTPKAPPLSTPKIPALLSTQILMKTVSTKQGSTKITFNTGTTDEPSSGIVATKVSSPQVLRHLTSSQQMEYKRLKLEIARREELMKLKARLGQPVSKSNNKREDQPKLEITVRNSAGGEADTSFRTVRQTEIETEERTVSINENQTSEEPINDIVGQPEVVSEERIVFVAENKTADSVPGDSEISSEKDNSLRDKNVNSVVEPSLEVGEKSEEATKQLMSEVAANILEQEQEPSTTEVQEKKIESPSVKGIGKRDAPANLKTAEPKKKRQKPAPSKMSCVSLLKLPDEEKRMKLNQTELELFSKRQEMLTQLMQLASLLSDMERGQAQTTDAEARVEALRRELARAESRAEEQRTAFKKLFTQVGQLRIEVAQTRMHCSGLSQTCQILGQSTQGPEYDVPKEGAELIKIHFQQVVELTKKTKQSIHPTRQSTPLPSNFPNTESSVVSVTNIPSNICPPKSEVDNFSNRIGNLLESTGLHEESNSASDSTVPLPTAVLKITDRPGPISSSPSPVEEPKKQTYLRVKPLKSLMDLECSDPLKETKLSEHFTGLLPDILSPLSSLSLPPSCPSLRPYTSPLEHMKPKIRLQHQLDDTMDPNKIMCPYALTGLCLDDECSFQHPRPSSTL